MFSRSRHHSRDFPITFQALAVWIAILGTVAGYQFLSSSAPAPLTTTIDIRGDGARAG